MQQQTDDLIVDFLDTESVQFVNPYEIHPILDANLATMPVTNDPLQPFGMEKLDRGELFPEIQEDVKPVIKMEQFSDLSGLLPTTPTERTSNDSIDELTTPIFEKGPFNYLSYNTTEVNKFKYVQNNNSVKTENTGTLYASEENINFNDLNTVKNLLGIPETEMLLNQNAYVQEGVNLNIISTIDNKIVKEPTNIFNFDDFIKTTADTEVINVVEDFNTNMYTPENTPSYVSSPKDTSTNSYVNSPEYQVYLEEPSVIHTPEDSNGSPTEPRQRILFKKGHKLPTVKVESIPNLFSISTPDVLSQVVDLGDDFNILDLVSSEDLKALETDEDLLSTITSPSNSTPSSSTPSTPAPVKQERLKSTTTRKRRKSSYYYDEDDDEYLPTSKKRISTVRLRDIDIEDDSESDYEETKVKVSKNVKSRGRPPKIAVLTDYKDSGVTRYRELRDKNNEASRKSRMKRKQKENELESEADELSTKNIKLKAQVEELEKMVSTFRNNLFHIMIKK